MKKRSVYLSILMIFLLTIGSFVFGDVTTSRVNGNLPLIARLQQTIEALELKIESMSATILNLNNTVSLLSEWEKPISVESVVGNWQVVGFVNHPEDFDFIENTDAYYMKALSFNTESVTYISESGNFDTEWMDDSILHFGDRTVSEFMIISHDDNQYMFWEWKSGDYSIRGESPSYYVLKKCSSAFVEVKTFTELEQALSNSSINEIYINAEIIVPNDKQISICADKSVILLSPIIIEGEVDLEGRLFEWEILSNPYSSAVSLNNGGTLNLKSFSEVILKSEISVNQNATLAIFENANVTYNNIHEIGPLGSLAKIQVVSNFGLERAPLLITRTGDGQVAYIVFGDVTLNYSTEDIRYDLFIVKGQNENLYPGLLRIPNYKIFKTEDGTNNRFLVAAEFGATVIIENKNVFGLDNTSAIIVPNNENLLPDNRILLGGNGESNWLSIYGHVILNRPYNEATIYGNELWIDGIAVPARINVNFNVNEGELILDSWNNVLPFMGTYEFINDVWMFVE